VISAELRQRIDQELAEAREMYGPDAEISVFIDPSEPEPIAMAMQKSDLHRMLGNIDAKDLQVRAVRMLLKSNRAPAGKHLLVTKTPDVWEWVISLYPNGHIERRLERVS
jgi:hypothetical protein